MQYTHDTRVMVPYLYLDASCRFYYRATHYTFWFPLFPPVYNIWASQLVSDDCPEDKREDYQNCSVLCIRHCAQRYAHTYEQFLLKPNVSLRLGFYSARNCIASAVLATAIPSVRLSVCLPHAGIVSKRRHVARCSFHRWIGKCV